MKFIMKKVSLLFFLAMATIGLYVFSCSDDVAETNGEEEAEDIEDAKPMFETY